MICFGKIKEVVKNAIESRKWPDRPNALNLEVTSICDGKCTHCPRESMSRDMKPMDFELFKKVIDQAAALKIPELHPNGYGELLTVRDLEKYLSYISSKEHKFKIILNSNAQQMNQQKADLLIKYRVDLVNISIDGVKEETIRRFHPNFRIQKMESNILKLVERRDDANAAFPKIRVGMFVTDENRQEIAPFKKKWQDIVDYVGFSGFSNRAGSVLSEGESMDCQKLGLCSLPFHDLNIWANGKAVLCCNDWNCEHEVGDVNIDTLLDIWRGRYLENARRLHLENRGEQIELCSKCDSWHPQALGMKLWHL